MNITIIIASHIINQIQNLRSRIHKEPGTKINQKSDDHPLSIPVSKNLKIYANIIVNNNIFTLVLNIYILC